MAGKIICEQSYVTNQALQQSSLLSTVFQGLVHGLSKDWNQPKESTTTAPSSVHTVIPATYRGRDSHSSVSSGSNSSAANSQVHTRTSTTETDYTRNAVFHNLTDSIPQATVLHVEGCSDTENLPCGVTLYSTNLPRGTLHTLMLFVIAKGKENGSLCYLTLRSRHRCPW